MLEEAYGGFKKEIGSIPKDDPDREEILTQKVYECEPIWQTPMRKLGQMTTEFTTSERKVHWDWVQKSEHWKSILEAPFCERIILQTRGLSGRSQIDGHDLQKPS